MKNKKVIILSVAAVLASVTIAGCGNKVNANATFATLDDTKITMGVANLYVRYQQAVYDQSYLPYFGEDMWSQDLYGSGSTMEDDVKKGAVEQLENMYLLKANMAEYDVALTEEDEKAIDAAVSSFMADNSKEALKQIGATSSEYLKEMLTLQTIQSKMHEKIIAEADTNVTDEEAAQRTFSYVEISSAGHYDDSSNYVEYTEEEKAGLKEKAETIAKAEDFEAAVTEAGFTMDTHSYGSAKDEGDSLDTAVLEEADRLQELERSGVVETEDAYYIVRLDSAHDEAASTAKKEELVKEKQDNHYNEVLDGWKEKAKWTLNEKEWEKITFKDHFKSEESTEAVEGVADTEGSASGESVDGTESVAK